MIIKFNNLKYKYNLCHNCTFLEKHFFFKNTIS